MVLIAEKEVINRSFDNLKNQISGRSLLESEKGQKYFEQNKQEGLLETDFIEYWDTDPLTRRCIAILHDAEKYATYSEARKSGLTEEKARKEVSMIHPIWGITSEEHKSWPHKDRPLPPELQFRFARALEENGLEWLHSGVKQYGSVNAFIRESIENGSIKGD